MATTYERVAALLEEKLGVAPEDARPDATFAELELDSLDLVELALAAEDEFGIPIPDAEAADLETVGDVVALLEAKGAPVRS